MILILSLYLISVIIAFYRFYTLYQGVNPYSKSKELYQVNENWDKICILVGIFLASLFWPIAYSYLKSDDILRFKK